MTASWWLSVGCAPAGVAGLNSFPQDQAAIKPALHNLPVYLWISDSTLLRNNFGKWGFKKFCLVMALVPTTFCIRPPGGPAGQRGRGPLLRLPLFIGSREGRSP